MPTNADLHALYEAGYAAGNTWHTAVDTWEESLLIHKLGGDWTGRRVLEIGCGEGRLAAYVAASGAESVLAVDYSAAAITTASNRYWLPNLTYDTEMPTGSRYHAIVMQGVLEHQDDWRAFLASLLPYLLPSGLIVTSSPGHLNPRGYVWQTLRLLLGVPMSLSDLHAIAPWEMEALAAEHGLRLTYESCHHDWAAGETLIRDYAKRLPNALRDAGLDNSRVEELLAWLEQAAPYYVPTRWSGANVVYRLEAVQ